MITRSIFQTLYCLVAGITEVDVSPFGCFGRDEELHHDGFEKGADAAEASDALDPGCGNEDVDDRS